MIETNRYKNFLSRVLQRRFRIAFPILNFADYIRYLLKRFKITIPLPLSLYTTQKVALQKLHSRAPGLKKDNKRIVIQLSKHSIGKLNY